MKLVFDESETNLLKWIAGRLSEPSTYLGLAGILVAFKLSPADASAWAQVFQAAGIFAGSVLAIVLKEAGSAH